MIRTQKPTFSLKNFALALISDTILLYFVFRENKINLYTQCKLQNQSKKRSNTSTVMHSLYPVQNIILNTRKTLEAIHFEKFHVNKFSKKTILVAKVQNIVLSMILDQIHESAVFINTYSETPPSLVLNTEKQKKAHCFFSRSRYGEFRKDKIIRFHSVSFPIIERISCAKTVTRIDKLRRHAKALVSFFNLLSITRYMQSKHC